MITKKKLLGEKKVTLKANFKRIQNQHNKRKKANISLVDENWNEKLERLTQLLRAENKDGTIFFYVDIRGTDLFESTYKNPSPSEDDARVVFNNFVKEIKKSSLCVIDSLYPSAKRFIMKYQDQGADGDYKNFNQLYNLKFIMAVSELLEEGFDILDSNKKVLKSFPGFRKESSIFFKKRIRQNRNIAKNFDDIDLNIENTNIKEKFQEGIVRMLAPGLRESTFNEYFFRIIYIVGMVFDHYPRIYPDGPVVLREMRSVYDIILNKEKHTVHNPEGLISKSGNYPMIEIHHLDKILNSASDVSIELYNFLILSLTTMTRPEEARRISVLGINALDNENHLNYKSGKIIYKTDGKVDLKKITNPMISTIGRVLLKYNHPINPDEQLIKIFFKKGEFWRSGDLEKYTERALRTTGGHMLAFCIKAKDPHKSNVYDVKDRMGHNTIKTAQEVYAKNLPHQSKTPEAYFQTAGIVKDDLLLTAHQPLWDAYLLKHWIRTMQKLYKKDDMKIIWNQVTTEAKDFLNNVAPDKETFEPDSF